MFFSAHPRFSIQTMAQSGAFSLPLLLALAGAQAAAQTAEPAAEFNYTVQIEAPKALQALLENNLDIVRWRGNQRIDRAQLQRLYRAAPDQIRELVATEGFYSPEISPGIEQRADGWRVTFRVQPGPELSTALTAVHAACRSGRR